jgi:hypothetical protein
MRGAAVVCQKMPELAEMGRGEGLPGATISCQKLAETGIGEEQTGAAISCQKIKEMDRGEGLPRAARKWRK